MRDRVVAAVGDLYEIEGEIGRGGTAVVYRARDVRLRRRVAIKVLPPELAFRTDVRSRFLREAQTAAALSHPNIVPIYTVDERDGLVFFVMGLVEGESLGALLRRQPRPPLPLVRRVLAEVADALAYAHGRGVIHRDIKPDNILLDAETGRALVTDFGIARALEEGQRLTVTGIAVGTPAFMSPEQALGERDVDARSDIYALGVLAYLVLAGELPFRAANTPAMLMKHISEPPPPLRERRPDLPEELARAVDRALRKKPEDRWPGAAAFRDALLGVGEGSEPAAAAPTVPPREPAPPAAPAPSAAPAPVAPPRRVTPLPAADRHGDPFPAAATLGPGGERTRELWRQEKHRWRERMRAREAAPKPPVVPAPAMAGSLAVPLPAGFPVTANPGHTAQPDHEARELERYRQRPLLERIRAFRRRLVGSVALVGFLGFINLVTFPFPWVFFPAIALHQRLMKRWRVLREEGVRWRDVLRGRVPPHLRDVDPAAERALAKAREREARLYGAWSDVERIVRRVRSLRRWALGTALLPVIGLVIANAASSGEPLAVFLMGTAAAGAVTTVKAVRLRRLGLRVRDMLRHGWEQAIAAADPRPRGAVAAAEAARLVSADVLAGGYGPHVRQAAEDRVEVREILRRLSPADRSLLPDVQPTVDALVERVALLAQALHRLDRDVAPDLLPTLERRIRDVEQEHEATPDRERRLTLLRRQRVTLEDLVRRRETLRGQLESASLVLQGIKLDLLKLRSAGVQAALDDVTLATQEARALSRDIGHVLDAAAEVRAI